MARPKGTPKPPLVKMKDLTEITLVGVYMVQKMGKPTHRELGQACKDKLGASIHTKTLARAMQGAAKGDFIAIHQNQVEAGTTETSYAMKNLDWKAAPEYAHIGDLLPVLLDSPEASAIKAWFDKQEGAGSKKSRRGNDIDLYRALRWRCISTDPLLGSQIPCQATDAVRKRFPTVIEEKGIEVEGIWMRDPLTGEFIIPQDVLQGWFAANALRYTGLAESRSAYIAFAPVRITPKDGLVEQLVLPVMSAKGPAAPKKYETLPPGQEFTISALVPTKGVLSVAEYERVVLVAGLRPKRGISPARGRRYGRFLVTGFEDLGEVTGNDLSFLEDDIPSTLLDDHGAYYLDAIDRLKSLPAPEKFDPGPFPRAVDDDDEADAA